FLLLLHCVLSEISPLSLHDALPISHVDHRRPDFNAAGLGADGRQQRERRGKLAGEVMDPKIGPVGAQFLGGNGEVDGLQERIRGDRKSTRLNSSHVKISYAVLCLKK